MEVTIKIFTINGKFLLATGPWTAKKWQPYAL